MRYVTDRPMPGAPNPAGAASRQVLPPHCLIRGRFEERVGAKGKAYAIQFELRIPAGWNGRLMYQGGGGLDGHVDPAIGTRTFMAPADRPPLSRGYAVVSTDSGHDGVDASFARDQQAKLNYGYAVIGKVTAVAKDLVDKVAGRRPDRTYFVGCSNGGREALAAAQRFPLEFDGVVAANPAFHLSNAVLLAQFSTATYRAGAPLGKDGRPDVPLALTVAETDLLRSALLAKCDALDGARDGFVFNHAACRFDPVSVECGRAGVKGSCLTSVKVAMLARAFAGPLDGAGRPLYTSWTYDTGVGTDDWRAWQLGFRGPDGETNYMLPNLVNDTIANYFSYPPTDQGKSGGITDRTRFAATAAITDATSTQFDTFAGRGGKMLLVTGWSDPIFAAQDLVNWYEMLDGDTRAATGVPADQFARLFLVPGMNHCGGGPSLDRFDVLDALVDWVEKGRAPDSMTATGGSYPRVSRPLCAYPRIATYRRGPRDEATSYLCAVPQQGEF